MKMNNNNKKTWERLLSSSFAHTKTFWIMSDDDESDEWHSRKWWKIIMKLIWRSQKKNEEAGKQSKAKTQYFFPLFPWLREKEYSAFFFSLYFHIFFAKRIWFFLSSFFLTLKKIWIIFCFLGLDPLCFHKKNKQKMKLKGKKERKKLFRKNPKFCSPFSFPFIFFFSSRVFLFIHFSDSMILFSVWSMICDDHRTPKNKWWRRRWR